VHAGLTLVAAEVSGLGDPQEIVTGSRRDDDRVVIARRDGNGECRCRACF
jgi:hypothetical protein